MSGDAPASAIARRLDALADATVLIRRHVGAAGDSDLEAAMARAAAAVDSGRSRLRHGDTHTVVALAGTTGSGKSTLLNAVAEAEIARTGLTRPTTAVAQAVTFGSDAGALLDWLRISRRQRVDGADDALDGLVLLDLPDFDSVELAHRLEVDRLVALVDLLVWVTDPQKYADQAWHDGYLQPLAGHSDVMHVVLNKVDGLAAHQLEICRSDLSRLLAADGLPSVEVLAVSARDGTGLDALVGLLAAEVQARQAMLDRLDADLRRCAEELSIASALPLRAGDTATVGIDTAALVERLGRAIGVEDVAAAVAAQHRRTAVLRTGWPPLRWLKRWRRQPVRDVVTTSASVVARAEVATALREVARDAAAAAPGGADGAWADALRGTVSARVDDVTGALDRHTIRRLDGARHAPAWWRGVGRLQAALQVVALLGLVWLVALAASDSLLRLDVDALSATVRGVPLPTWLLLGGVGAGLLLAWVSRLLAAAGAARLERATAAALRRDVAEVAEAHLVDPLTLVGADGAVVSGLLLAAAGGDSRDAGRQAAAPA